jgi:hypothetical protein
MFDRLRRVVTRSPPPARILLAGGVREGVYTDRDFATLRQIILDQRLLERRESRVFWEVSGPVPGYKEYAVVYWWSGSHSSADVEVKFRGTFDEAVAFRAAAVARRDARCRLDCTAASLGRESLAVDVTDAVMAREPGYV